MRKSAVILIFHWSEIQSEPMESFDEYYLTKILTFKDPLNALEFYANYNCPESILIDYNSIKELRTKINKIIQQFNHPLHIKL